MYTYVHTYYANIITLHSIYVAGKPTFEAKQRKKMSVIGRLQQQPEIRQELCTPEDVTEHAFGFHSVITVPIKTEDIKVLY